MTAVQLSGREAVALLYIPGIISAYLTRVTNAVHSPCRLLGMHTCQVTALALAGVRYDMINERVLVWATLKWHIARLQLWAD